MGNRAGRWWLNTSTMGGSGSGGLRHKRTSRNVGLAMRDQKAVIAPNGAQGLALRARESGDLVLMRHGIAGCKPGFRGGIRCPRRTADTTLHT
jgi:hypothetical protein